MSNINQINNLSHAISPRELESKHSANTISADQDIFTASFSQDDRYITAAPLFSDNTSIQEITHSIISCIGES